MIIAITGTNGAGKGAIVEILKKRGFKHISAREDIIIPILIKEKLEINRDNMLKVANRLRENDIGVISKKMFEIARKYNQNCVIESLRSVNEVKELLNEKDFLFWGIDCDINIRYERIKLRKTQTDDVSFEKFLEQENKERSNDDNKSNIKKCLTLCHKIFINDSSLENLEKEIEKELLTS